MEKEAPIQGPQNLINVSKMIYSKYVEVVGNAEISQELRFSIKKLIFDYISEQLRHELDLEQHDQLKLRHYELKKNATELGMKLLADGRKELENHYKTFKDESKAAMESVMQVLDVAESSSKIVVPLARRFKDINISQSHKGGAYISLEINDPRDPKEIIEFGIKVTFADPISAETKERRFIVNHEVGEGFELEGWPKEGQLCPTMFDVFVAVEGLGKILVKPALDYIIKEESSSRV